MSALAAPGVDSSSDAAVRRFGFAAGEHAEDALRLAVVLEGSEDLGPLRERWSALDAAEDLANLEASLDGAQVMSLLGLAEGPEVGEVMAHLLEVRLEEGPMTEDEVAARLSAWWELQPRNSSTS